MFWPLVGLWLGIGFVIQFWCIYCFASDPQLRREVTNDFFDLDFDGRTIYVLIFASLPAIWPVVLAALVTNK